MFVPILAALATNELGYIAGTADGIVTVGGVPSSRQIVVLDVQSLVWLQSATSTDDGNYLIMGLDPTKEYLIMARDYQREYEPAVWDYVRPMSDKTLDEQMELWQSWH